MRRPAAAVTSLAWFAAVGGTFGCLLPYLLNYWHFHQPLRYWWVGQALLFGSAGLLEYTAAAWIIGAAAVRFYEEPVLTRKFGADYREYRRNVPAWIPRLEPWTPGERTRPQARTNAASCHPPATTAKRALPGTGGKEHPPVGPVR